MGQRPSHSAVAEVIRRNTQGESLHVKSARQSTPPRVRRQGPARVKHGPVARSARRMKACGLNTSNHSEIMARPATFRPAQFARRRFQNRGCKTDAVAPPGSTQVSPPVRATGSPAGTGMRVILMCHVVYAAPAAGGSSHPTGSSGTDHVGLGAKSQYVPSNGNLPSSARAMRRRPSARAATACSAVQ